MNLTARVKIEVLRLGFDFVGTTKPDPPQSFPQYQKWLKNDRHGEMSYMATQRARERRANPLAILPDCKSIIVLGIRHNNPTSASPLDNKQPQGRIATYAWGDDYHDVLPARLKSLCDFIENEIGEPIPNHWYTDTGPILERDLAQQAGLGWIGKNSMLINPQAGSYFLLSEILLGIELEPDPPFASDHCGTCTRCIEACPTDCILEDRTIDARRCISYLTIELKGPIPRNLRPQMKDWVFGCDICQEVCPWNIRFAPQIGDSSFAPRSQVSYIDLAKELTLTSQEFNQKFKESPVKRTKRRGYLRNVAVALGNANDPSTISAIIQALREDSEPLVRGHAAWALGQIGGQAAQDALQTAIDLEPDDWVREEITASREKR